MVKTSETTKGFWRAFDDPELSGLKNKILNTKNGEIFEYRIDEYAPLEEKQRFKGDVYVLVDRFSFSNAVSVASIVQDYRFAKVIGAVTADSPTNFGAAHGFTLPATQLTVMYPKAFFTRPNGSSTVAGLVPDFEVYDDPFTEDDEVLDFAHTVINQHSNTD